MVRRLPFVGSTRSYLLMGSSASVRMVISKTISSMSASALPCSFATRHPFFLPDGFVSQRS